MLITLTVLLVAKKSRTFIQSPMFSWWAAVQELAGGTARQPARAGHGNIPHGGWRARYTNGGGPGGRNLQDLQTPGVPRSLRWDRLCNRSWHGDKNCIVYHFFCIFFIIIPSFVVLLNCLYLKTWVLLFAHPPPHPTGGEWASGRQVLVAGCRANPRQRAWAHLTSDSHHRRKGCTCWS